MVITYDSPSWNFCGRSLIFLGLSVIFYSHGYDIYISTDNLERGMESRISLTDEKSSWLIRKIRQKLDTKNITHNSRRGNILPNPHTYLHHKGTHHEPTKGAPRRSGGARDFHIGYSE
jgi:hypothetical protein